MNNMKALLDELRADDPRFDEAQTVVDLVRGAGDLLERMRERKGWSQAELAKQLGITTGRVSQLESGTLRNAASLKMLARVAHVCGETLTLGASGEVTAQAASRGSLTDTVRMMGELSALGEEVHALRAALQGAAVASSPNPAQWSMKGEYGMPLEPMAAEPAQAIPPRRAGSFRPAPAKLMSAPVPVPKGWQTVPLVEPEEREEPEAEG